MRLKRFILPALTALLLALCVAGWLRTREVAPAHVAPEPPAASNNRAPLIDDSLLKTAQRLLSTANTSEGQEFARDAVRLSDHELDEAFAGALRAAAAPSSEPVKPELKKLHDEIANIKAHIAADQATVAKLTKAASDDNAAEQLELAKAQLDLDRDELDDARQDLARLGGDRHGDVERLMQQHEAATHGASGPPKINTAASPATLLAQLQSWLALRELGSQVAAAQQAAEKNTKTLETRHEQREKAVVALPQIGTVARLAYLSNRSKALTELDKRIQDSLQLSTVYKRWHASIDARRRAVLHLVFASLSWILGIVAVIVITGRAIHHAFNKQTDRRRRHQLRVILTVGVQVIGILSILFVIFGPPSQLSTIIGLATAGITVVLKDFIISFFGWFVLMGRNGVHVGDWVEIEGVGGEVIEIGLMRTVLLEVGNWTDKGHPTGRRVAFMNSFAMEHHYFNFSTSDQWLWDELIVSLPSGIDPYQMAQRILETVQKETEKDAHLAEQDWQRVTHQYATRTFSAKPAVDIRPAASGGALDVRVRYITRAPQRYEVKSRLFEAIVELLHKSARPLSVPPPSLPLSVDVS